MHDEIISSNQLYLQDVVCGIVAEDPKADDFTIYNKVVKMTDVPDIETVGKILELIKLNKLMLSDAYQ